ncbi:hypothetical protein HYT59_01650 [Candidatus Woesebacteria bacterium]|nr:hypothetical protein [Candidatus Woesebacteria bacterium]
MASRSYYQTPKRLEKLGRNEQLALMFDLINAISLVKRPTETALLLKDLLTAKEIKNLSKRLRIAKLILADNTEREIAESLHCSFATIAKVRMWLNEGGEGLRKVISKLPKRYKFPKDLPPIPLEFQLPRLVSTIVQYSMAKKQASLLEKFAEGVSSKQALDKSLKEATDAFYSESRKPRT